MVLKSFVNKNIFVVNSVLQLLIKIMKAITSTSNVYRVKNTESWLDRQTDGTFINENNYIHCTDFRVCFVCIRMFCSKNRLCSNKNTYTGPDV